MAMTNNLLMLTEKTKMRPEIFKKFGLNFPIPMTPCVIIVPKAITQLI